MMLKTKYIVFEGTEGVGKSTQCDKLNQYLLEKGYLVLKTKEPGIAQLPLTMSLRNIMLNNDYNEELTRQGRELISQTIRSVHIEKLIKPAMGRYDFIIQDRGILSGLAYGVECGNSFQSIENLMDYVGVGYDMYDTTIYLKGNTRKNLEAAISSKSEFDNGDAIEARGYEFIEKVSDTMDRYSKLFNNVETIDVTNMDIGEVHQDIKARLRV